MAVKLCNDEKVSNPLLRYYGGKWVIAPWIISHFSEHRVYVEPFGGGANVLLRKSKSDCEVYNDLDSEVVNLFQVLRSDPEKLISLLELTPFSRDEFDLAYEACQDPVEKARRLVIRSFQGVSSASGTRKSKSGWRNTINPNAWATPSSRWENVPGTVRQIVERFRGVIIENKAADYILKFYDAPDTMFYVDPPYLESTRRERLGNYRHEMSEEDHLKLANMLRNIKGMAMVSGYQCELYDSLYAGWNFEDAKTFCDGKGERTERIWMNFEPPQRMLI